MKCKLLISGFRVCVFVCVCVCVWETERERETITRSMHLFVSHDCFPIIISTCCSSWNILYAIPINALLFYAPVQKLKSGYTNICHLLRLNLLTNFYASTDMFNESWEFLWLKSTLFYKLTVLKPLRKIKKY